MRACMDDRKDDRRLTDPETLVVGSVSDHGKAGQAQSRFKLSDIEVRLDDLTGRGLPVAVDIEVEYSGSETIIDSSFRSYLRAFQSEAVPQAEIATTIHDDLVDVLDTEDVFVMVTYDDDRKTWVGSA